MRSPARIDSHSNGASQIIKSPKPSSRMAAPVRTSKPLHRHALVRRMRNPGTQIDPEGGHPVRVVGGNLGDIDT